MAQGANFELVKAGMLEVFDDNPRFIKDSDFERLVESIRADGSFFTARPCLVNRTKGRHIVYAGAQRFRAAVHLGMDEIPCFVEDDVPEEVVRKRCLLDNHHSGRWDTDILANSWDMDELMAVGEDFLKSLGIPEIPDGLDDIAGEADFEEGGHAGGAKIKYEIIFDDEGQRDRFCQFLAYLKKNFEGGTIAERLTLFINQNVSSYEE